MARILDLIRRAHPRHFPPFIRRIRLRRLIKGYKPETGDYFYITVQDRHGDLVQWSDKAWRLK